MRRLTAVMSVILPLQILFADDAASPSKPAVEPAILQSVEEKYSSEVARAEAIAAKAQEELAKSRKVAGEVRLKSYKDRLTEITKSGDFDKAIAVKARIEQLEKDPEAEIEKPQKGPKRPRPKDTVKFGGHTYALIKEPATWHVAKQRCEEMGGHLAVIDSAEEDQFVRKLCGAKSAWLGASDEEDEGVWEWIVPGVKFALKDFVADNTQGMEHSLYYASDSHAWRDWYSSGRMAYVCEWDR